MFNLPPAKDIAWVLQFDLDAAGIEYENDSVRVDFHALRGRCLSRMTAAGVSPKTLQEIARHSTIELMMKHYARSLKGSHASAAVTLPDFSAGSATK